MIDCKYNLFNNLLSHEDSNLDRQNQNLLYYLYTMGQKDCKSKVMQQNFKTRICALS